MKLCFLFVVTILLPSCAFSFLRLEGETASCTSFQTCADCLGLGKFCGWCSPSPTIYNNGTEGTRCQDQRESGWLCNHLYSTDHCLPGYACNSSTGQCYITAAGHGDTQKNCEKSCHKTPPPAKDLTVCDIKTKSCLPCKDYCHTDKDCPSSYCQAGLCHGSSCEQKTKCDETCTSDTPDILLGVWRGVAIQKGFQMGEIDLKFEKKSKSGYQVAYRDSNGAWTGDLVTDVSTGGRSFTVTIANGAFRGKTVKGSFNPWEPGPETEQFAFILGAIGGDAPPDIQDAMEGKGNRVLVLSRCSAKGVSCDFSRVFPKPRLLSSLPDPCNAFDSCSACIAAPSHLCGWCSVKVTYNDSRAGAQCAGFDSSGVPLGWNCTGEFNKNQCSDYGCDWTNIKQPKCRVCSGPECMLSKEECSNACKPPPPLYQCDNATKKCNPCKTSYCTKDIDCPGSYCQISGAGPWSCHGTVPGGCSTNTSCAAACGSNETFYSCDQMSGKCKPVPAGTHGAQTKWECDHACKSAAPIGTWRGVMISKKFTQGEYDVTFYDDSTVHIRDPMDKLTVMSLSGSPDSQSGLVTVTTLVIKCDDPTKIGQKGHGLFKVNTNGNDGIAKFLWLGQGSEVISSFDQGMEFNELVLIGCKTSDKACDFGSAKV